MKTWLAGGLLILAGCDILDRSVPFEEDLVQTEKEVTAPAAVVGRTYKGTPQADCVTPVDAPCGAETVILYVDTALAFYISQGAQAGDYSPYVISPEGLLSIWPGGLEKAFYIEDNGSRLSDGYGGSMEAGSSDELNYYHAVSIRGRTYRGRSNENCGQMGTSYPGMCNGGMVQIFADTNVLDYCSQGSDICFRAGYTRACDEVSFPFEVDPPTNKYTIRENGRRLVGNNGQILYLDTTAETHYYHEIPLEGNTYSARPDPACGSDALGGFECNPMYVSFGSEGVADFGMGGSDMLLKVSYLPVSGADAVMVGDQEFIILEMGRKLQAPDGTILEIRKSDIMYLDGTLSPIPLWNSCVLRDL